MTAFCELTPTAAAVRVAVVVDAHRATAGAANALLKTLEDAPPNKRLLLVAPGRRYLAPTVASRCGLVAAPLPSAAQAAQWLQTEHGAPAQAAADALAYFGGRPVAALAALAHHETRRELGRHLARGADLNLAQAAQLALAPEWGIEALVDFMQKWGADGARAQRGLTPRYFAFAADFFRRRARGEMARFLSQRDRRPRASGAPAQSAAVCAGPFARLRARVLGCDRRHRRRDSLGRFALSFAFRAARRRHRRRDGGDGGGECRCGAGRGDDGDGSRNRRRARASLASAFRGGRNPPAQRKRRGGSGRGANRALGCGSESGRNRRNRA